MSSLRRLTIVCVAVAVATLIAGGVALAAVIKGNAYANTLTGTVYADSIYGYAGNDTISGLHGNDYIDGGDGADQLFGGDSEQETGGNERIVGGNGNDTIAGSRGTDNLAGGYGADIIFEGPRYDAAVDTISGGPDNDLIYAASGKSAVDTITCGLGQDEAWVDSVDSVSSDCETVHRDPALADVTFSRPLQISEVVDLANQRDANIEILEGDTEVGAETIHDFYALPDGTVSSQLEQEYEENRLNFFSDMVNADQQGMTSGERAEMEPQLEAMKEALQRNDAGATTVSAVTVSADLENLQALANESSASGNVSSENSRTAIEEVEIANLGTLEEKVQNDQEAMSQQTSTEDSAVYGSIVAEDYIEEPALGAEGTPPDPDGPGEPPPGHDGEVSSEAAATWYPNKGRSEVRQSSKPGHRYTWQYHRWYNKRFAGHHTYEHDFFLVNTYPNYGTYLTSRYTNFGCFPRGAYVVTTYPKGAFPYMDTNLGRSGICDYRNITYTIGAAHAAALQSGKTYYNYIRTPAGLVRNDVAFLQGQLGYRSPQFCVSTFCSFGYNTSGTRRDLIDTDRGVNKNLFGVPGTIRWHE